MSPLDDCLSPPERWADGGIEGWWKQAAPFVRDSDPSAAAIRIGARVDRMAYAFAGGYLSALNALLPDRDRARTGALCVTERGGTHPRAIEARLDPDGRLSGDKTFVTLGRHAADLYVLASEGRTEDGKAKLVLLRVLREAERVTVEEMPALPFVPEVTHAKVVFDGVECERIDGDGWADFVRPFRTIEDTHVHLGVLGWLMTEMRRWGAAPTVIESGLVLLEAFRAIAADDPSAARTHLTLAGAVDAAGRWIDALDWAVAPPEDQARFERDRMLLGIAHKARIARTERARRDRLGG